jgi:hypothetical protein
MQKYVSLLQENIPLRRWHCFEDDQENHRHFGSQMQNIRLHIIKVYGKCCCHLGTWPHFVAHCHASIIQKSMYVHV